MPGVAGRDRKTSSAAGQNNSSPTPQAASAANGEWESVNAIGSHYCFIITPDQFHSLTLIFEPGIKTLAEKGFDRLSTLYTLQTSHSMAYRGLQEFIRQLEKDSELIRIKAFADPVLEITEITDRITKSDGKALLFENNGTRFPLLINAFGSDQRLKKALGLKDIDNAGMELMDLFGQITGIPATLGAKLKSIPALMNLAGILPKRSSRKGRCQEVIMNDLDLSAFPVLKCWPYDGGRFITLPMVHTVHPVTGKTNVGMYRMQMLDKKTTGMHWQRHKTGASHFEAWKKTGKRMPVTVTLGGDPVYTYAATAPLPENIDEYILAGFLRKKGVSLVKCITNDLYVPDDADIVIEGYVDPNEELVWEGPFGDHTGFYSLADWYPAFHITCISHSKNAVYPATIVGIPPMEDAWLAKATERIFLAPVKLALQPEVLDFHMPDAGVAHNLAIIKLEKTYPGQGKKVLSSLMGAGQMMFTKYMIAVSGDMNIRNYNEVALSIFRNTVFRRDMTLTTGPLDVLDHSSDTFSFGGKAGIDATIKFQEENSDQGSFIFPGEVPDELISRLVDILPGDKIRIQKVQGLPVLTAEVGQKKDNNSLEALISGLKLVSSPGTFIVVLAVEAGVPGNDLFSVAWQILGNSDPVRDIYFFGENCLLIDGTVKAFRKGGFRRNWPNVVCSSPSTIAEIDRKWGDLNIGDPVVSPSGRFLPLGSGSNNEIISP